MKIKIDECLPQECSALLHQKGYNIDEWQGYLVVATDHKIRIKMPKVT
jgi:hypothetical protein